MSGGLDAALQAIFARSAPVLRERVERVEAAAAALREGALDDERREDALRAAHQLAGSLGTFGLDEGTRVARAVEDELDGTPDADRVGELSARLHRLVVAQLP